MTEIAVPLGLVIVVAWIFGMIMGAVIAAMIVDPPSR